MRASSARTQNQINNRHGFTIVELLIVVVVIAVLAAITIVSYNGITKQAGIASLKSDLQNSATKLAIEQTNNGSYPVDQATATTAKALVASDGTVLKYVGDGNNYCLSGTSAKAGLTTLFKIESGSGTVTKGKCFGGITTTIAGSNRGSTDGTGTAAQFYQPTDITIDSAGNLYVAEQGNHLIRKITSAGIVTTVAGSNQGATNGTGAAAQFYNPSGITVDPAGNLYVSDYGNHLIRKVTPTGAVTTFAGSSRGSTNGTGAAAKFDSPFGITIDSAGNLYVADSGNGYIRKITSTGVVTTVNNDSGVAVGFNNPRDVAIDSAGSLYVTDYDNHRIRKITSAGVVTTLAGSSTGGADGTGIAAQFNYPASIAVDQNGNLYVTDQGNHRIRKITPTAVVTTLVGSTRGFADGTGTAAQFYDLIGIAVDPAGNLYVADYNNNRIRKIE